MVITINFPIFRMFMLNENKKVDAVVRRIFKHRSAATLFV